jgi:hypothetical protein
MENQEAENITGDESQRYTGGEINATNYLDTKISKIQRLPPSPMIE